MQTGLTCSFQLNEGVDITSNDWINSEKEIFIPLTVKAVKSCLLDKSIAPGEPKIVLWVLAELSRRKLSEHHRSIRSMSWFINEMAWVISLGGVWLKICRSSVCLIILQYSYRCRESIRKRVEVEDQNLEEYKMEYPSKLLCYFFPNKSCKYIVRKYSG